MFISMTGFGRATKTVHGKELVIEIKSVNHKGLDVFVRSPQELNALEPNIIQCIKSKMERGRVELAIYFTKKSASGNIPTTKINPEVAEYYIQQLKKIAHQQKISDEIRMGDIVNLPGVVSTESPSVDSSYTWADIAPAVDKAVEALLVMRKKEGAQLQKDIVNRIKFIELTAKKVKKLVPIARKQREAQLHQDVQDLLKETKVKVEANQIISIAVGYLDQTDITEELVRVESHIQQFYETMKISQALGRKIDFILQEMFREFNTIGSKTSHPDIGRMIVEIKAELEKLKQQIANIE